MEKKKVMDRRNIRLEEVMKRGYIPFLAGRPARNTVINSDDVCNVAILVNTTGSVDELIKRM